MHNTKANNINVRVQLICYFVELNQKQIKGKHESCAFSRNPSMPDNKMAPGGMASYPDAIIHPR